MSASVSEREQALAWLARIRSGLAALPPRSEPPLAVDLVALLRETDPQRVAA